MTNPPKVSVIMAAYNAEKFIQYAIQSVLNQTFGDFEFIITGDGCTDQTAAVVRSFNDPRIEWGNLPENVGSQGIANNQSIKKANGQYIAYLGHDNLWFPWHLEKLLKHIEENKDDWAHSTGFAILPSGHVHYWGSLPAGFSYSEYGVGNSLWIHRRDLAEEVGGWRHHNQIFDYVEVDLQRRIAQEKHRMSCSKEPSVLKFYALAWSPYSAKTVDFPQKIYFERILNNAPQLQIDLLKQVANQHGQEVYARYWGGFSALEALKILIWRPFRRWIITPAKHHIPVVRKMAIWQMQRYRKNKRARQTGKAEHTNKPPS